MDKKFIIEIHQGQDYLRFTVNGKQKDWNLSNGEAMFKLLKQFLKGLIE